MVCVTMWKCSVFFFFPLLKMFKKLLLRCNSYKKLHHSKGRNSMAFFFFLYFLCCTPLFASQTFPSPQQEPPYLVAVILSSPTPWQSLIYLLSLWIRLFWTFHIKGITYVAFRVWLLFISIIFCFFWKFTSLLSVILFGLSGALLTIIVCSIIH